MFRISTKLVLLAGAATALQGCVAAVVPIAASGLMGGSGLGRDARETTADAKTASDPKVIVETSPAQDDLIVDASARAGESRFAADERVEPEAMLKVEDEPAARLTAETVPSPAGNSDRAAQFAETDEMPQTDPTPPADMPVRVIAVDSQAALAGMPGTDGNVSAAEAAAALSIIAAAEESEPVAVDLARKPPEPSQTGSSSSALAVAAETPAVGASVPPPANPAPVTQAAPVTQGARTARPRPLATGDFAALINYANQQQSRSPENRASAFLADRASLRPDRAPCGAGEPTVLIDLDPEGATFDPTNASRAAPRLSSALAQIRAAGIRIAWISRNAQGQVGAIREALNRSGLDLENADELLLMRYPEDRKQTRREDLAASSCLIAIAGDERADFDELFEYLINPEAAATLDPLIDSGWFIIPPPLVTERPTP